MQGPEASDLELTKSLLPPWGQALSVPESTTQASKGEKKPTILPSYEAYEPQQPYSKMTLRAQ